MAVLGCILRPDRNAKKRQALYRFGVLVDLDSTTMSLRVDRFRPKERRSGVLHQVRRIPFRLLASPACPRKESLDSSRAFARQRWLCSAAGAEHAYKIQLFCLAGCATWCTHRLSTLLELFRASCHQASKRPPNRAAFWVKARSHTKQEETTCQHSCV